MADLPAILVLVGLLAILPLGLIALGRRVARSPAIPDMVRRGLVAAPGLAYAFWAVRLMLDPAAHTLWPLEMAFVAVMWLLWIALIAVIAAVRGRTGRAG